MARSIQISTMQELADWLDSLGYFSVDYDSTNSTIELRDGDSNVIATLEPYSQDVLVTLYAYGGQSIALPSYKFPTYIGVTCSGGAVLHFEVNGDMPGRRGCLVIAKNQNNKVVFAYHQTDIGDFPYYYDVNYRSVSWDDSSLAAYKTDMRIMNQTILVPICSRPQLGQTSYCETAFLMYSAQSNAVGQFILNGSLYYSTGWFAIKDD